MDQTWRIGLLVSAPQAVGKNEIVIGYGEGSLVYIGSLPD